MLSGASNWYARTANTADGPVRREMTGMQELRVKENEMTTHLRSTGTALAAPALIAIICVGLAGCSGAVPRSGQSPDGAGSAAGHPDLMVLTAENSTLSPGAQFTLSATVKNVGGGAAAATMLSYYRSDDATITTDDAPVGTDEIAALAADQSARESMELTAPTTFGTYYYGACVDAVTGETEQANNCSASVRITVTDSESDTPGADTPDLMVVTAENSTLSPGAQFTLSATVKNVGGGAAAATMLSYYRSDDATITTDDTPVGTDEIAALAADQSASESTELTAPTTFGTYYYGACVDAVTGETEQANNCSASVRITVTDSESDTPGAGLGPAPTPDESTRPLPMIRVADERATEGVDLEFVFRVTLDEASSELVTVRYATEDISALAGNDYYETSGTLTFAAGEVNKAVKVEIIDDSVEDSEETMKLVLSDPTGAQLADAEAIGTIWNTEPPDDYASNIRTTGTVSVGSSQTGALESHGDRDWIRVILVGGTPYVIHYEGAETGRGTLVDPYLHGVYDSNGDHVPGTRNDNGGRGRNSRIVFTPDTSGTYFLGLGTTAPSLTGTYRVAVGEFDDAVGDVDVGIFDCRGVTATTVTVGSSAAGNIRRPSQVDWFAVALVAGTTYRIDIQGSWTGNGTLRDTRIAAICNPSGDLIDGMANDNSGRDLEASTTLDAATTGTYHIGATVGEYSLLSTGTYKVYVTPVGADDYSADATTTGSVSVGSRTRGEIETPGDVDWFAVTFSANTFYTLYLYSGDYRGSTPKTMRNNGLVRPLDFEAIRGVYSSDGSLFEYAYDDAWGDDCTLVEFYATYEGTYYVAVGTVEGTPNTGDYWISVDERPLCKYAA